MTSTEPRSPLGVRRAVGASAVAVALVALAACQDPSPSPDGEGSPSAISTSPSAGTRIPLEGTASSPLIWEIDGDAAPGTPLGIAQLYEATELRHLTVPNAEDEVRAAFARSATGRVLDEWTATDVDGNYRFFSDVEFQTGPTWTRLTERRTGGRTTRVVQVCRDIGGLEPVTGGDDEGRRFRAVLGELHLRLVLDGSTEYWRVNDTEGFGVISAPQTSAEEDCVAWATHRTDEGT